MSILSIEFVFFFLISYIVYWLLRNKLTLQNSFILTISYLFYALIDWRFCLLLFFISLFSYVLGLSIQNKKNSRFKIIVAIVVNIGVLFWFKYYNFFAGEIASLLGLTRDAFMLSIALPVGISFYIFTATGYLIDVYKGKIEATKNIVSFFSFISFFPLLLSGPIERSNGLLPQFKNHRIFNEERAFEGIEQVVWGAFKKLVIADNCATVVSIVFANYMELPASSLAIGGILYSVQIYFDFSGYSDIAIGLSKLLGFNVCKNFHYPYFSLNVSDFWRRWHMSLQRWLTDYIYIPLGGSRGTKIRTLFNTFTVFLLCGLWHGANWTFVVWGIYHALLFIPVILIFSKDFKKRTVDREGLIPSFSSVILMITTFLFITIGWIIFNSPSLSVAFSYITRLFSSTLFCFPAKIGLDGKIYIFFLIVFVYIFEWVNRNKEIPLYFNSPKWIKVVIIYVLIIHILLCGASESNFIYYQF